jgi:hypothetical protein
MTSTIVVPASAVDEHTPRPRRRGRERERTAYHEAGHAIMAHACGIAVKRISIVEDEGSLGRMHKGMPRWIHEIDHNVTPYREIKLHQHIMVYLAGAAATAIYAHYGTWRGTGADLLVATHMADCVTGGPEETDALLDWLWIRTRQRLAVPPTWARVEAVATALLARHALTGQEVCGLLVDLRTGPALGYL